MSHSIRVQVRLLWAQKIFCQLGIGVGEWMAWAQGPGDSLDGFIVGLCGLLFLFLLGLHCCGRASHCGDFSCCGAQAPGHTSSVAEIPRL